MSIIMLLFGIGLACFAIWKTLTTVLPAYLGFVSGYWSLTHGAGAGAVIIGLAVAMASLTLGRWLLQSAKPAVRLGVALLFALPAGYAGFCAAHELAAATVPSEFWQLVLSALAALCVSATALARLQEPSVPAR